jgi:dTDP-glucose 4,6-dehydratase
MIEFVEDRKGHDRRYALNGEKARTEIGFESTRKIQEELPDLLQWYSQNANWWKSKIS